MTETLEGNKRIIGKPKEGILFEVNLSTIDLDLFEWSRRELNQENIRQLILDAFTEALNNPKYAKPFKTFIPEKTWKVKSIKELKKVAEDLGGRVANWVEQALEWAQKISNGEPWEVICNLRDDADWSRLVEWKGGYGKLVGGSQKINFGVEPSFVSKFDYSDDQMTSYLVPLVVFYD